MKMKSLLFALLILGTAGVKASGNMSNVEAMYIYNFLRHINWPEAASGENFVIGVMGDNETFQQLTQYTANRKVGTKSIIIKKVESVSEAAACQLVFVPTSRSKGISELKNHLGNKPCLIVSEKEGSNATGSTIEFVLEGDKLKFRVNEERAKQQNLIISRSLLDMSI